MENIENTTAETVETKPKRKQLLAEIAALRAYVAGVRGDAFPESEDK